MPLPTGLNMNEMDEFLYLQIQTINEVLSATVPGFNEDIIGRFSFALETADGLPQISKDKMLTHMRELKDKYKTKVSHLT